MTIALLTVGDLRLTYDSDATGTTDTDAGYKYVRRPTNGVQLKKETVATLTLSGGAVVNSSSPDGRASHTCNFMLQAVQEQRSEKFQSIPTFGAPYGYFFGQQPMMYSISALLFNTADFQWEVEWWYNYENYLRGTRLVDRNITVTLEFDDTILTGYILNASTSKSEPGYVIPLSFSMWVTDISYRVPAGETQVNDRHKTSDLARDFSTIEGGQVLSLDEIASAEVRKRNIDAYKASQSSIGLLEKIQAGIEAIDGFLGDVGDAIEGALDFLYGTTLVVPAGSQYDDLIVGPATFSEGVGTVFKVENGEVSLTANSITVRQVPQYVQTFNGGTSFYERRPEEYPFRSSAVQGSVLTPEYNPPALTREGELQERLKEELGITYTGEDDIEGMSTFMRAVLSAVSPFAVASLGSAVLDLSGNYITTS